MGLRGSGLWALGSRPEIGLGLDLVKNLQHSQFHLVAKSEMGLGPDLVRVRPSVPEARQSPKAWRVLHNPLFLAVSLESNNGCYVN